MPREEYTFDGFISSSAAPLPADEQLENLQRFVNDVGGTLQDIQAELDPHSGAHGDAQDAAGLVSLPTERVHVRQLVKTENFVFDKIMAALGTVLSEMRELTRTAESEFLGPLSMFGEEPGDDGADGDGAGGIGGEDAALEEGELALQVSRILPLLRRLSFFLNRAYALVCNVVQQLASLYNERERLYVSSFRHVHMTHVFEELGWFFVTLITIDEVISRNVALTNAWAAFKRMIRSVKLDPARYGTDEERLRKFEKLLLALEGELLDGLIFQNCIEQDFDVPSIVSVRNNGTFKGEFYHNLRRYFDTWSARLSGPHETDERREFVGIAGLYVLHFTLYRDDKDKKFFKALADTHRRIPLVHLHGATTWDPTDFLAKKLPTMARLVAAKDVLASRREISRHTDATLPQELAHLRLELSTWSVRMASTLPPATPVRDALNTRISLLVNGVCLAHRVSSALKTSMLLHIALDEPVRRGTVQALRGLGEVLKGVEAGLARCAGPVAEALPHCCKQVAFAVQRVLLPVQARLRAAKKFDDARLDAMAAISLMSNLLCGTPTEDRLTVVRLAFDVANSRGIFRDDEVDEITRLLWKLGIVAGFTRSVRRACDTGFLYWSRELVGLFIADIYANPDTAHRLQYVLDFLRDPLPVIATARHTASPEAFVRGYEAEIAGHVAREIIEPLCRDIETDLRLHVHSAVHRADTPAPNPLRDEIRDLSRFLDVRPVRLGGAVVDLRAEVSFHLESTFYNLTTVALHDWKTYGEMRSLAHRKYGLNLAEGHLPSQTLEQGLDVLEIMRNIHIFVARYGYNLNAQVFVERSAEAKHLNTISIRHVANSIRTHGTGVMNTTVNFVYQFLLSKFKIFSQFLFDDHVKSPLVKDARFYRDNRDRLDNMYPYARAQRFIKDIRKLGVNAKGQSFLDRFRELVTQIGNALGYVRMVRSGGLHYLSNAIKFVPDIAGIEGFATRAEEAGLGAETKEACANLDAVLENLSSKFSEGTDYFAVLVQIFVEEMRSESQGHLRNFAYIVPPLIVCWVEHMVSLKDKMSKTKKREAAFTDDGFAIGLAYILHVLGQNTAFDGLHWFQSMTAKFKADERTLKESIEAGGVVQTGLTEREKEREREGSSLVSRRKGRRGQEDMQTVQLTQRRLEALQTEAELLYFAFSGARILFKDSLEEGGEQKAGEKQDAEKQADGGGDQTQQQQEQQQQQQPPATPA